MIDTKNLWFAPYFFGEPGVEWLTQLAGAVEKILAAEPERGKPAVVDAGAKISGPVVFGKNCVVGHGALVVGPAIFGDDCVIGHASEVTRSILGNDSRAAHFNYVGDSILGSGVNLGAGAKLANSRFDKQPIKNLSRLGAIIGDRCQIGCNAVLSPGVILENDVWFAGAFLPTGTYDKESIKKYFHSC